MSETKIENTEAPIGEVRVVSSGTWLRPRSLEELREFVDRENRFWSPVFAAAERVDNQTANIRTHQLFQQSEIDAALAETANLAVDDGRRRQRLNQALDWLSARYGDQHKALIAADPRAVFVVELASTDPAAAVHALGVLMGLDPMTSSRPLLAQKGQILAHLYGAGINALPAPFEIAWGELSKRVAAEHEALRAEAGRMADVYRSVRDKMHSVSVEQGTAFDAAMASYTRELAALRKSHEDEMENIRQTFKRDIQLKSAVSYLNTKATTHRLTSIGFGVVALAVAGILAVLGFWLAQAVFVDDAKITRAQIGVTVLAGTLSFWLLRILVRVFLSNLHLATDMRMRATFVQTYLALIAEGAAIKDDDRQLIISLVFRPTTDGLVRDDATPPGFWDVLTRGAGGRQ